MILLIWIGIVFCLSQSAVFSGLNLAFFSISKLRLEIESQKGNQNALKVAKMREDSNFLLTTILWGNVGINVLLTLLSNSVMAGVVAFLFSTVVITFMGEVLPQAYFSRHAMKMGSMLAPLLRLYQLLLYPVAKPTALILDTWLGPEAVTFFREQDLQEVLRIHMDTAGTEIEQVEGRGAINFLSLDDLSVMEEGEPVLPESIVTVPFEGGRPLLPAFTPECENSFLRQLHQARKKWVILQDKKGVPRLLLDTDGFLRDVFLERGVSNPLHYCHRPIIIHDEAACLGDVIQRLKVMPEGPGDDVIDEDVILVWGSQKRVITGADILGRLLRGIAQQKGTIH